MDSDNGWDNILYWIMRLHVDDHAKIDDERTRLALCELLDAQKVPNENLDGMVVLR